MDIAFLSRSPQGIDFALLASLMPGRLARSLLPGLPGQARQ